MPSAQLSEPFPGTSTRGDLTGVQMKALYWPKEQCSFLFPLLLTPTPTHCYLFFLTVAVVLWFLFHLKMGYHFLTQTKLQLAILLLQLSRVA